MSEVFLEELGIGEPDHMLGVGSGTHAEQTARVIERIEPVLREREPGPRARAGGRQLDARRRPLPRRSSRSPSPTSSPGLRSFDRSMPEELNRVLVDHLSELLFLHCDDAVDNLTREGIDPARMQFVGNTMIDTLVALSDRFRARESAATLGLEPGSYLLVTLHRPALVDGPLLRGGDGGARARRRRDARRLPGPSADPEDARRPRALRAFACSTRSATSTSSRSRPTRRPC